MMNVIERIQLMSKLYEYVKSNGLGKQTYTILKSVVYVLVSNGEILSSEINHCYSCYYANAIKEHYSKLGYNTASESFSFFFPNNEHLIESITNKMIAETNQKGQLNMSLGSSILKAIK